MAVEQSSKDDSWPPLESNPEAFTQLAHKLGLKENYQFTDVFGTDPDLLGMVPRPCHAVVLLFPTQSDKIETARNGLKEKYGEQLGIGKSDQPVYMHQYVGNACGTFALCHSLMNVEESYFNEDAGILKFKKSTAELNPEERGKKMSSAKNESVNPAALVLEAHMAVANNAEVNQTATPDATDKVEEHFTAFVPSRNTANQPCLLELDGRLKCVLRHNWDTSNDFLEAAANHIQKNFFEVDKEQTHFSMIALCGE